MLTSPKTCFTVRDGALVGDFRDALQPMVWRMDLSRVHAAGFRVVPNGSQWDLIIESPSGGASAVAGYHSQDKANRALRNLSGALRRSGSISRAGGRLGTVAIVLLVLAILFFAIPRLLGGLGSGPASGPSPVMTQPQGEALPADQVLRVPPSSNK